MSIFISFLFLLYLILLGQWLTLLLVYLFTVQCPAHEVRFDSTGVILSPGFPENYPNLQMCSWLINVEKGYNITLHFELFQTEKEFDILEIFDGGFCWYSEFINLVKELSTQNTNWNYWYVSGVLWVHRFSSMFGLLSTNSECCWYVMLRKKHTCKLNPPRVHLSDDIEDLFSQGSSFSWLCSLLT